MASHAPVEQINSSVAEALEELALACRVLEIEGHSDRIFGHMALRDPDGRGFWMKRRDISLGEVHDARDFILLNFDGKKLAGDGRSHSEWPIHSEIFRRRPDVVATAHTHPFYASVYSASEDPLKTVVARGSTQPFMPPRYEATSDLIQSPAAGGAMAEVLGDHEAVFLRNHGIVTCGRSIPEPVLVGIALEKMCREVLTIGGADVRWTWPDAAEVADKKKSVEPVRNRSTVWEYYLRKLARAEAQGDTLLGTEPIPVRSR